MGTLIAREAADVRLCGRQVRNAEVLDRVGVRSEYENGGSEEQGGKRVARGAAMAMGL